MVIIMAIIIAINISNKYIRCNCVIIPTNNYLINIVDAITIEYQLIIN